MEFLVHIEINWPPEADEALRQEIFERELEQGQLLARAGLLRRLWRVPGRWANWSLYEVADTTELHEALTSLPLYPWMDIQVHAMAEHPNDPRALGIVPEPEARAEPANREET